ncbi:MAG TPA: carboxypeptidase-like regulatory domain-containing protein [Bryobacteraceae bacterium]|nr:carboxypeptidase-like regulatory domain-containing protein [Bryobacteraceae bacterium]
MNQFTLSNGSDAAVFSGATNTLLHSIHADPNVGINWFNVGVLNQTTNQLYAPSGGGVVITDLNTGTVAGSLLTSLKTGEICTVHSVEVNASLNWIYVVGQCQLATAVVFVFDGVTGAQVQTVDLGADMPLGSNVLGMVLNPASNKLYIANNGGACLRPPSCPVVGTEVYNAATFTHLASIPGVVAPYAVDSVLNAIYGTSILGAAVIDGSTDTVNSQFPLGFSVGSAQFSYPITVNEATHMVYFANVAASSIAVYQGTLPSPGTLSISGRLSGTGAVGVTITAVGGQTFTAVTDTTGSYTLTGLPPAAYVITPSTAGRFYSPLSQSVNLSTVSLSGINFAALSSPISITGLTFSPYSTIGAGVVTNGVVSLNQPAPAGGVTLSVSSSNKVAKVPATATVAAGATTGTIAIQGSGVNTPTSVSITASYSGSLAPSGSLAQAALTVAPGDTLHVLSATFSKSTQLLKVTATSTNPQSIINVLNASGNVPLGIMTSLGNGSFSYQTAIVSIASVNLKSNLGGATGQGVTILP